MRLRKPRVSAWAPVLIVAVLVILTATNVVTPSLASSWLTFAVAAVTTTFLIVYTAIGRWWRKEEGRTVVSLMAVLAATAIYASTALIWGPYVARDIVRLVVWSAVLLVSIRITALLIRRQREGRAERNSLALTLLARKR